MDYLEYVGIIAFIAGSFLTTALCVLGYILDNCDYSTPWPHEEDKK